MNEKYKEAALRHFTDAETLAGMGRFDNAGHLIGFAAECAIKFAVRLPDEERLKHLPVVAEFARRKIHGRTKTPLFNLLNQTKGKFFHDWHVRHRYSADGFVTAEMYKNWRSLAQRTLGAMS